MPQKCFAVLFRRAMSLDAIGPQAHGVSLWVRHHAAAEIAQEGGARMAGFGELPQLCERIKLLAAELAFEFNTLDQHMANRGPSIDSYAMSALEDSRSFEFDGAHNVILCA
jgi:hypothetical protein